MGACIGVVLNGKTLDDVDAAGGPIEDDTFLFLLNPHDGPIDFYMPKLHEGQSWEVCLNTCKPTLAKRRVVAVAQPYELAPRSAALLREVEE
jgi:isoamylase